MPGDRNELQPAAGSGAPDQVYELAAEDPSPRRRAPGPGDAGPKRVLSYRPLDTRPAPPIDVYFPSRFRDLYLPACLLAAGMALGFAELVHLEGDVADAAKTATFFFLLQAVFLLLVMPILTKWVGVAFGTLPQAVLKLCAIALLPAALGVGTWLAAGACTGLPLAVAVSFAACWTMFAILFDLDLTESRLCAAVYWAAGLMIGGGSGFAWWIAFRYLLDFCC